MPTSPASAARPGPAQPHPPGPTDGFTLIELIVVVLIIGVLLAIAIPTFLGARKPASDRQAQSLARTAMLAARSVLSDTDSYAGVGASDLAPEENTTSFVDQDTVARATKHQVSVGSGTAGSGSYVIFASYATSGRCFALLDWGDRTPGYQRVDTNDCKAAAFSPADAWTDTWP